MSLAETDGKPIVSDLAMDVRELNDIIVNQAKFANTACAQIESCWTAESATADYEHAFGF